MYLCVPSLERQQQQFLNSAHSPNTNHKCITSEGCSPMQWFDQIFSSPQHVNLTRHIRKISTFSRDTLVGSYMYIHSLLCINVFWGLCKYIACQQVITLSPQIYQVWYVTDPFLSYRRHVHTALLYAHYSYFRGYH